MRTSMGSELNFITIHEIYLFLKKNLIINGIGKSVDRPFAALIISSISVSNQKSPWIVSVSGSMSMSKKQGRVPRPGINSKYLVFWFIYLFIFNESAKRSFKYVKIKNKIIMSKNVIPSFRRPGTQQSRHPTRGEHREWAAQNLFCVLVFMAFYGNAIKCPQKKLSQKSE